MTEKGYPPSDINPPGTSETGAYPPPSYHRSYSGPSTAGYSEQPAGQAYPYSDQQGYQPKPYPNQQYAPQQQPYSTQPPAYGADAQAYPQQQQSSNVTVVASQPPVVAHHTVVGVKPPNYIALSLINLLCCCWPLGIVGLIYSLKVDSEYNFGRLAEAQRASETAKTVNYVGLGLGTALIVVYIVIIVVIFVTGVASASSSSS